jgi:hypothetical protein
LSGLLINPAFAPTAHTSLGEIATTLIRLACGRLGWGTNDHEWPSQWRMTER